MKYYLDTCIWMDYYEDRDESAYILLCKLLASNSRIIVSKYILEELQSHYTIEMIRGLTIHFEKIMVNVEISDQQFFEAEKIAKQRHIPVGDALHAILARDNKAIIVTRDKHFQSLKDICKSVKPKDII